ncbi:MAG: hypothetical protein ACREFR_14045, partial [Limisphaerales bacterium]
SGVLYQYNQSVKIYECPANMATHLCPGTDVLKARQEYSASGITSSSQLPQVRTCSINYNLGGFHEGSDTLLNGDPPITKYNQIRSPNPGPAQMIVFCDENEYSVDDGCFAMYLAGDPHNEWWNLPGSRHDNGTTWSFADGHVEYWKWHGSAVLKFRGPYQDADPPPPAPGSSDDLSRVQACFPPLRN